MFSCGRSRFIRDAMHGCDVLDHCERFGTLVKADPGIGEPIVMCVVTNRTPEEDGSFKKYYLRVPPVMKTAHEAVAWTFGMTPDEYDPIMET